MNTDKINSGRKLISQLNPEAVQSTESFLNTIAPDFATIWLEFPFGSIYSRPGLDLRTREIATLAALITKGTAPNETRAHIVCALNAGVSRQEIIEVIMQMSIYAGFPEAINGFHLAAEVFAELDSNANEN
ncbi:carboxymuconolactone decarboxylase family protein [Pseudomonas putida]